MKCIVTAGELAVALRGPCDRAKATHPIAIFKHVRLAVAGMTMSILGHDGDSSSESTVPAEVEVQGSRAVPAEPLARIINGLPKAAAVTIEIVDTDAIIKSGRSRYKLPSIDAKDMPTALSSEGGRSFELSANDLEQVFVRSKPAIDLKSQTMFCRGIYLHPEGGKLSGAATSGKMLMRFQTAVDCGDFAGATVPRYAIDEIVKFGPCTVTVSDRIISASADGRVYASKLIAEKFPEHYRKIIQNDGVRVKTDRVAVIESLSRLRAVIDYSDSELLDITASGTDLSFSLPRQAEGRETIECEASAAAAVCLKASELLDAVKAMTGDRVEFVILSERAPFRVIDPSEPSAIAVIMPCTSTTLKAQAA